MAEKPTGKPRRDLRARLGKTITPKTGGGAPAAEDPAAAPAVASAAAPAAAAEAPAPAPTPTPAPRAVKAATPAPVLSGGIAAPPSSIGAGPIARGGVVPPGSPFAAPAPVVAEGPADPFAAQKVEHKVVRIEFDDKPVADSEVGKTRFWVMLGIGVVLAGVAAGLGFMGGQTVKENQIFERTVRDAVEVHGHINTAKRTLDTASQKVRDIVAAARGNQVEGTPPRVDFAAIEALRALERPFQAQQFTDKNYNALGPAVVNDLFTYLMNVERLFQEFETLANLTLGETQRRELTESLDQNAQGVDLAAVLHRNDQGQLVAEVAFLEVGEPPAPDQPPPITVRPARNAQGISVQIYAGSAPEEGDQDAVAAPVITTQRQYAILVDVPGSPIFREVQGASGRFFQKIGEIAQLLAATTEIQGRLLTAISGAIQEAGGPPED